jgi:hypothetical protein
MGQRTGERSGRTMTDDQGNDASPELTYAWNWFAYHAGQRFSAFNFFLVIVGVLTVGFGQAVSNRWIGIGVAIGAFGAAVGAGFILLDVRNKQLVDFGTDALEALELGLAVHIVLDKDGKARPKPPVASHTNVFRAIEGLSAMVFAAGMIWALGGYSGLRDLSPSSSPRQRHAYHTHSVPRHLVEKKAPRSKPSAKHK